MSVQVSGPSEIAPKKAGIPEITAEQLHRRISEPNRLLLLDVRNDEEFERWKVEGAYTPETLHVFYGQFLEEEERSVAQIPRDREIVAVCAYGGTSEYIAGILRDRYAIRAVNLKGGMVAWGNYYSLQTVIENQDYQIYQIGRVARGCLSYLIASGGEAILIDPLRHTEKYSQILDEKGLKLAAILDTHAHADHISGGPALAAAKGAPYYLHPYDAIHPFDMLPASIDYEMLRDAQSFTLGGLTLRVLHVPGHTLGQVNFLVRAGDGAAYLFSGDNLFLQSFGRPDLGGQGEAWAPLVYRAIFETVRGNVPAGALVLPGHFAQAGEAGPDGLFAKPLGRLWQENRDLAVEDEAAFIRFVLENLPAMPQEYIQIKRVNAGLAAPDEEQASELELGKNICALSTAY